MGLLKKLGMYIQKGYIRIADIWKLYVIHNKEMVKNVR